MAKALRKWFGRGVTTARRPSEGSTGSGVASQSRPRRADSRCATTILTARWPSRFTRNTTHLSGRQRHARFVVHNAAHIPQCVLKRESLHEVLSVWQTHTQHHRARGAALRAFWRRWPRLFRPMNGCRLRELGVFRHWLAATSLSHGYIRAEDNVFRGLIREVHEFVDEALRRNKSAPALHQLACNRVDEADMGIGWPLGQIMAAIFGAVVRVKVLLPEEEAARGWRQGVRFARAGGEGARGAGAAILNACSKATFKFQRLKGHLP
eukprot:scaffold228702_cov27-Tisochrysis_lutea.AAC.2